LAHATLSLPLRKITEDVFSQTSPATGAGVSVEELVLASLAVQGPYIIRAVSSHPSNTSAKHYAMREL